MKIAFIMPTPFSLGGEQRVTSIIANSFIDNKDEVSIICTDSKVENNYKIYNLNEKVNVIKIEEPNVREKLLSVFCKILGKVNRKTNLIRKNEKILEYIYFNRDKKIINELEKIVKKYNYDYLIGVGGRYSLLITFLKGKVKSKLVGWQHSCYDAYFNQKGEYYWHEDLIFKKKLKLLDNYIVLTKLDKEKINKNFKIKCEVINNPKSFESHEISSLENKNFLSAGRIIHVKGYDLLIESFSIFAKKNKEWKLTIVGEGKEKNKIEKLIKKYKLENRVKVEKFTNDIKKYMLNSSTYLLSSRWEGMPMVVLEAYETGLPVVSFDIDAMKELTGKIKTGIIVEKYNITRYAEAMLKMAEDYSYRKNMGENARIKSKEFAIENIQKKWKKILNGDEING